MKRKYLLLIIILFMCLFLFSTPYLALIPGDFGSAGGGPPDGVVDFEDLMIFAMAYGSTPSDGNWNLLCDAYPDNVIDFEDLMVFAMHYGEFLVHNLNKDTYYNTIQAALDDADSGNTIEVSKGTYTGSITFPSDKAIILKSVNGPGKAVIIGDDDSETVYCNSPEDITLEGLYIKHLTGETGRGITTIGGIAYTGHMIINDCDIAHNSVGDGRGGGIENYGRLTITDSNICYNSAYLGGGIHNETSGELTIINSSLWDNSDDGMAGSMGGAINNDPEGKLSITGSLIDFNSASEGGGIFLYSETNVTIGGSSIDDTDNFNNFRDNYETGFAPSASQHIRNASGDCHASYPYNNFTPGP